MPELPEVETIVGDLRRDILGRKITGVRYLTRSVWRKKPPRAVLLLGARVNQISRRGKHILIHLSNEYTLVFHLKMTGRLTYENSSDPRRKHTHLILNLDKGQLRFNDIRRFGYIDLVGVGKLENLDYLEALGPDAMEISKDEFIRLLKSKKRIIKSLLVDQSVLAGLGNIYTDEALHLARIHPRRVSARLSVSKLARLHDAILETLRKALAARGSSVDNYVDGRGAKGSFQEQHLVYGREGKPCRTCGRPIRRLTIGSRSTHYCPECQR